MRPPVERPDPDHIAQMIRRILSGEFDNERYVKKEHTFRGEVAGAGEQGEWSVN
jgi:hypothetical protein